MLTRDAVMNAAKPALGSINVPEWGGQIAIRMLGAVEVADLSDEPNAGRRTLLMVMFGAASADGARLFSDADEGWLRGQPWDVILRVSRVVGEHCGLSGKADTDAGN